MERPILFSSEMVRAILDGRKTQTRRVIKPQPNKAWSTPPIEVIDGRYVSHGCYSDFKCPYGQPGDRLWVRETWMPFTEAGVLLHEAIYKATDKPESDEGAPLRWRPSIFMPRWASRITLEIIDVRVERVQEISLNDCESEGSEYCLNGKYDFSIVNEPPYLANYHRLWDSINAKRGYGWDVNPFCWVVEFTRVD